MYKDFVRQDSGEGCVLGYKKDYIHLLTRLKMLCVYSVLLRRIKTVKRSYESILKYYYLIDKPNMLAYNEVDTILVSHWLKTNYIPAFDQ